VVHLLGILAIAKTPLLVKVDFTGKVTCAPSEEKRKKTSSKPLQKKRTISPLEILKLIIR
jgi:hypothetical protein